MRLLYRFFVILSIIIFFPLLVPIKGTADSLPPLYTKTVPLSKVFMTPIGNIPGIREDKYLVLSDKSTQAGAMWGKYKINLNYDFTMDAYMYFGNSLSDAADGMTFTLQTIGNNISGDNGQYLGAYGTGPQKKRLNGIAIEFDTYHNSGGTNLDNEVLLSSGVDHTAFYDIKNQHHLQYEAINNITSLHQLSAGFWYKIRVTWTKNTKTLKYKLEPHYNDQLPFFQIQEKSIKLDTRSLFNGDEYPNVYWGFTGSTGQYSSTNAVAFSLLPQPSSQDVFWEESGIDDYTGYDQQNATLVIKRNALYNLWDNVETRIDLSNLSDTAIPDINNIKVDGSIVTPTLSNNSIIIPKTSINKATSEVKIPFKLKYGKVNTKKIEIETTGIEHVNGQDDTGFSYNDGKTDIVSINVIEDKTNLSTKDSHLYRGQLWDKSSNFVSAIDQDGNPIFWGDYRININNSTVNTNQLGVYNLKYTLNGKIKNVDSNFKVTVIEDNTNIITRNTTIKVGQSWDKSSNFVSATDQDGNPISWGDYRINTNNYTVDTNKPGVYNLKYTLNGKIKNVDSTFTVTVEDPLSLVVPLKHNFGKYQLGSEKSILYWDKNEKIEVADTSSTTWELEVSLNKDSSLQGYLKIGDQTISEIPSKITSGTGSMVITDQISEKDFIKIDYSNIKQLRKDAGLLEWSLSPSIKAVKE